MRSVAVGAILAASLVVVAGVAELLLGIHREPGRSSVSGPPHPPITVRPPDGSFADGAPLAPSRRGQAGG